MSYSSYILEIYDTEDYSGPNPVKVTGVGIIKGPENSQYLVIEPDEQIMAGTSRSRQLAVRAHYDGDPISHVTDSVATVGIALLSGERELDTDRIYNFNDLKFWKVGKISPRN